MNLSVRVSSKVLLTPSLAATAVCMITSSWSCNARKSLSVLENARASLPVVGLTFVGGSTPRLRSQSANLLLDMRVSVSRPEASNNLSLNSLIPFRCSIRSSVSTSSTGSANIRIVRSISLSSCCGNPSSSLLNKV